MRALLLAAGLGTRLRPMTLTCPKPLLPVAGQPLITYHLESLAQMGVQEVWINTHHLADQFEATLGSGAQWGLRLHYCYEPQILDTAGGIANMLEQGRFDHDELFWVISSDAFYDLSSEPWEAWQGQVPEDGACIGLVDNPAHHVEGDFGFDPKRSSLVNKQEGQLSYTYSGMGIFSSAFFKGLAIEPAGLGALLHAQIASNTVRARLLQNYWMDVGTPERLATLEAYLNA